jgi:hypothetical protein
MRSYKERDARNTWRPIEWRAQFTIMLGTRSDAGVTRRMDGSVCAVREYQEADPARLEKFALTGQWEFPHDNETPL